MKRSALFLPVTLLLLIIAIPLRAQSGCMPSFKNPLAIPALVGAACVVSQTGFGSIVPHDEARRTATRTPILKCRKFIEGEFELDLTVVLPSP
jgi:hypothetical protein